jgi:hypothetical protein
MILIIAIIIIAQLFSRVTAAVTSPDSNVEVKSMFENFIRDVQALKQRK